MGIHVVISGNPVDGFTIWGTFKTSDDAIEWASHEIEGDWWIAPLEYPIKGDAS